MPKSEILNRRIMSFDWEELKLRQQQIQMTWMKMNSLLHLKINEDGPSKLVKKFSMKKQVIDNLNRVWVYEIENGKPIYRYSYSAFSEV
jgi:hypothetical protein